MTRHPQIGLMFLMLTATVSGCCWLCPATCPPPPEVGREPPPLSRQAGCRGGARVFFVDTPVFAKAPDERFVSLLLNRMRRALDTHCEQWFGGTQAPQGAVGTRCDIGGRAMLAYVEPVLNERTFDNAAESWRNDGHRRFFNLWFALRPQNNRKSSAEAPRLEAQPQIVETLRTAAAEIATSLGHAVPFRVGRIWCSVSLSGVEAEVGAHPTDPQWMDLSLWHLRRMGIEALPAPVPQAHRRAAHVMLVDSGVDFAGRFTLDAAEALDLGFEGSADGSIHLDPSFDFGFSNHASHRHGTDMIHLIRQTAGGAAYVGGSRALDLRGASTMPYLAVVLDDALFNDFRTPGGNEGRAKPRVLSMSLGTPPELGWRRAVKVLGQTVVEDAYGEPIRYLLAGARKMDTPDRPLVLLAAAGNRPDENKRWHLFGTPQTDPVPDPCGQIDPSTPEHFVPATWDNRASCPWVTDAVGPPVQAVTAIGATDCRDARSGRSIPNIEAPLVAPGEHVYAWSPLPEDLDPVLREHFAGRAVTGTSAATALVAGAAARGFALLARRAASHDPPVRTQISGVAMERLLYITGESVQRRDDRNRRPGGRPDNVSVTPVRRLSLCRLERFFSCPAARLDAALNCLETGRIDDVIDPRLAVRCGEVAEGCINAVRGPACWEGDPCAAWPDARIQSVLSNTPAVTMPEPVWSSYTPDRGAVNHEELVTMGPQPPGDPCPECYLLRHEADLKLRLMLELNDLIELPQGVTYELDLLRLTPDKTGSGKLSLGRLSVKPGQTVVIDLPWPKGYSVAELAKSKPLLHVTVVPGDASSSYPVTEPSVLRSKAYDF